MLSITWQPVTSFHDLIISMRSNTANQNDPQQMFTFLKELQERYHVNPEVYKEQPNPNFGKQSGDVYQVCLQHTGKFVDYCWNIVLNLYDPNSAYQVNKGQKMMKAALMQYLEPLMNSCLNMQNRTDLQKIFEKPK